jgi:hypothetical protein
MEHQFNPRIVSSRRRRPFLTLFLLRSCAVQCYYTLKDSPHPHSPFEFGLLNVNSLANSDSSQSIVVPTTLNKAMGSINTCTPCATISTSFSGFSNA